MRIYSTQGYSFFSTPAAKLKVRIRANILGRVVAGRRPQAGNAVTMAENLKFQSPTATLAAQTEHPLRLLVETGLLLARERSLDIITQTTLDAGLELSAAAFGAFFYSGTRDDGQPSQLYKLAGTARAAFRNIPLPTPSQLFADTLINGKTILSKDITLDPHLGIEGFAGLPAQHLAMRSYLAVPVASRSGEVIGALLYGHASANTFTTQSESLITTLAAQAAIAIDNARLAETLVREIAVADAARSAQRETADRLRQALDAAQLGTWTWNRDSDLLDLDERAAELFFTEPHKLIARSAMRNRIVAAEDRESTVDSLRESLESKTLYRAEYRVRDPSGPASSIRWIVSSGVPVLAANSGRIIGMTGTIQDITARKMQESTLRESEKLAATGRLAATIAHEINNPLEAVTNLIYLAKTDPEVPAHAQRLLETADAELVRVSQIAQQTLGFYRDTTRPVEIDLNQLLDGVVDLFARKLVYSRVTCSLDLAPNLCIFGLQGEIRQVFSNLLVNAIDASQSSSGSRNICIRAHQLYSNGVEGVSVLITDQGTGIPPSIRAQLFAPFITTKTSLGTGLGLWVTRGIIEKHGGTIAFRTSSIPPTGTVFRVFLPLKIAGPEVFSSAQPHIVH